MLINSSVVPHMRGGFIIYKLYNLIKTQKLIFADSWRQLRAEIVIAYLRQLAQLHKHSHRHTYTRNHDINMKVNSVLEKLLKNCQIKFNILLPSCKLVTGINIVLWSIFHNITSVFKQILSLMSHSVKHLGKISCFDFSWWKENAPSTVLVW